MNAIEVRALRKSFGRTTALDGLDLTVRPGEVHAFLGPNGAGKTTTIRILLGLLRRDGGEARLLGGDPWRAATALHRRLAYVPGDVTLWPGLTGGEIIDLLARLRGPGPAADPKRRQELIERFALDPAKKSRAYSKGNRQKVALIAALASDAELLILDEPTSGLDPLMEEAFRECVADERAQGRTVLLSSHILAEVEALCDRVSIIRNGRTVETGTLQDLRHLTRTSIEAELTCVPQLDLPGVHALQADGTRVRAEVDTAHLRRLRGRDHRLAARRARRRPGRADEHPHRRPPHARGRGGRAGGARGRGRDRPAGAARRRAAGGRRGRCRPRPARGGRAGCHGPARGRGARHGLRVRRLRARVRRRGRRDGAAGGV